METMRRAKESMLLAQLALALGEGVRDIPLEFGANGL